MDHKVGVEGRSWDAIVACRHGAGDRVTDLFMVEVLDEGSDEVLEAASFQWVRRPAWNRFLAFSNSLAVERRGF
jgi:hypothetical protein